jgi:hypothetical protein
MHFTHVNVYWPLAWHACGAPMFWSELPTLEQSHFQNILANFCHPQHFIYCYADGLLMVSWWYADACIEKAWKSHMPFAHFLLTMWSHRMQRCIICWIFDMEYS